MILPLRHENMSARRWPVVTLALIIINFVVFFFTLSTIDDESLQTAQTSATKEHILILAAMHPGLAAAAAKVFPAARPQLAVATANFIARTTTSRVAMLAKPVSVLRGHI